MGASDHHEHSGKKQDYELDKTKGILIKILVQKCNTSREYQAGDDFIGLVERRNKTAG